MKASIIREIGVKKGVKDLDLFVDFICVRFPNEPDEITSYVRGPISTFVWADIFNSGHPECYMDEESEKVYRKLKGLVEK